MVRAFIAVDLPDLILRRCQEISDRLRNLKVSARFSKSQSIHLTLKFLGNIEEDQIPSVAEILKISGQEFEPFQVEIQGVGVFPHLAKPRVVWVGIQHTEALITLQGGLETQLERMGFSREKRQFKPHLTLARLKSGKNMDDLVRYIQNEGVNEEVGVIKVGEIHLYQSILKPEGAEYRKLATARLTADS